MVKTRLLGVIALALLGAASAACDDDDPDDFEDLVDDRIDDLDLDDDLVVTRSEWLGGFVLFDDDNDRVLVLDEFRFNGGAFDLADTNNDNFVTEDEWEDLLDDLDIDDDDVIDELEFDPYL